jgi:hypothetical protein
MAPGVPERRTHTYVRNGTTSLFAALDIATGAVIGKCYKGASHKTGTDIRSHDCHLRYKASLRVRWPLG